MQKSEEMLWKTKCKLIRKIRPVRHRGAPCRSTTPTDYEMNPISLVISQQQLLSAREYLNAVREDIGTTATPTVSKTTTLGTGVPQNTSLNYQSFQL